MDAEEARRLLDGQGRYCPCNLHCHTESESPCSFDCYSHHGKVMGGEFRQEAALIAAAPDLAREVIELSEGVERLRSALGVALSSLAWCDGWFRVTPKHVTQAIGAVRAALDSTGGAK
jgi:hypothetical protein